MSGLIGAGAYYRRSGLEGLGNAARGEQERREANQQIEQSEKASTLGLVGTGAGIGASVGGPYGAMAGAAIGLMASLAF